VRQVGITFGSSLLCEETGRVSEQHIQKYLQRSDPLCGLTVQGPVSEGIRGTGEGYSDPTIRDPYSILLEDQPGRLFVSPKRVVVLLQ
jgi:hypothetical protein